MHTTSILTRNTVKEKKGIPVWLTYLKNLEHCFFWRIHRRTSRAWSTHSPDVVRICDIPLSQCSILPLQLPRYKPPVRQPQLDNKRDLDRRPNDQTVVLWWKHHWNGRFRQSTSFLKRFHISTRMQSKTFVLYIQLTYISEKWIIDSLPYLLPASLRFRLPWAIFSSRASLFSYACLSKVDNWCLEFATLFILVA